MLELFICLLILLITPRICGSIFCTVYYVGSSQDECIFVMLRDTNILYL